MYFSSILWIMGTRVSIISLPNISEREKFKYTFYILHMNYMFFARFITSNCHLKGYYTCLCLDKKKKEMKIVLSSLDISIVIIIL